MSCRIGVAIVVSLTAATAVCGQSWDPNKVWYAGDPGSPSAKRYVDANTPFPGWTISDSVNATHQAPSVNPGGIDGLMAGYFRVVDGKEKHRTDRWTFSGDANTRTAMFWRIYVPSNPQIEKLPSIQVRTHNLRHHLDFSPDVTDGNFGGPVAGWVSAEDTVIESGGRRKPNDPSQLYLPMPMDSWHTIRVEVGAGGQFEAWIDEEEGLSDVGHITAVAKKTGSGGYVEIGVRSTVDRSQYWTNYLAWGQDATASGGANEILPLQTPSTLVELCDNDMDDDGDGLADCMDPGCLCVAVPEDNPDACRNGEDDDLDGLVDCEDPDCAGAGAEDTPGACHNGLDDDCDGLTDCADPGCSAVATEDTPDKCYNGYDDDCDGLVDCEDPDCGGGAPENTFDACTNAIDEDCDGLFNCDDPDCATFAHCSPEEPHYAVTMIRQIGNWQNSCGVACNSVIYASVYDEDGTPLNGVVVRDPTQSWQIVTAKDPGQPDGQNGHGRYDPFSGVAGTVRLRVVSDSTHNPVSSDVTPPLFSSVPPNGNLYTWQVEFMRKSKRRNQGSFALDRPTYIFDEVKMNTPGGDNLTLKKDWSDLLTDGGQMYGQTFKADCDRIVSARVELTRGHLLNLQYAASIHELVNDPPTSLADIGPQIGPTRHGPANMIGSEWWTQMLNWPMSGPDSVPVIPGHRYFLKIWRADVGGADYPFVNTFLSPGNHYKDGAAVLQLLDGTFISDLPGMDVVAYIVGASLGCRRPAFDVRDSSGNPAQDGRVDQQDLLVFTGCVTGPAPEPALFEGLSEECQCMDRNGDHAIDQTDFAFFQRCYTGPTGGPVDPNCAD